MRNAVYSVYVFGFTDDLWGKIKGYLLNNAERAANMCVWCVSPKCDFYSYLFGFLSKNMALRLEAYPPDNTSCRGPVQVITA